MTWTEHNGVAPEAAKTEAILFSRNRQHWKGGEQARRCQAGIPRRAGRRQGRTPQDTFQPQSHSVAGDLARLTAHLRGVHTKMRHKSASVRDANSVNGGWARSSSHIGTKPPKNDYQLYAHIQLRNYLERTKRHGENFPESHQSHEQSYAWGPALHARRFPAGRGR